MSYPVAPSSRLILALAIALAGVAGMLVAALAWPGSAAMLAPAAVAVAGLGLALRFQRDGFVTLGDFIARLSEGGEPPAIQDAPVPVRALAAQVSRLNRNWRRRFERTEAALAANEAILEALDDPVILVDASRHVVRLNDAAKALFGERALGRDLAGVLRHPNVLDAVDAVIDGAASRAVELTRPTPVEQVFVARVKRLPEPPSDEEDEAGRPVILTLHDITEIRRAERLRADFVANASHELRTPLASLLGFIETLRGPARDDVEAHDRFLGIMHDQAGRMTRLVNDLLSLSRIELDEHRLPTAKVDVASIVRSVVATLELKARGRRIRLSVQAEAGVPPVAGDEDQLIQVLQNLIDNAIKYGRDTSEVTIRVALVPPPSGAPAVLVASGRSVAVSVQDHGDGIERTHLPRLTERFYRVDAARSRALGGTGLGLAIVKHIVNRHRGLLTIESEVGQGSVFTVYLPPAEMAAVGTSAPATATAASAVTKSS